jgi:Mg-chelatase subunit ChlD
LVEPLGQSYETLINSLNKTEAKGQTALGPALLSSIEVASKGSPGSSVVLCTDGLANIGVGLLDPFEAAHTVFYSDLAKIAKERNVIINLITIKGESAKM